MRFLPKKFKNSKIYKILKHKDHTKNLKLFFLGFFFVFISLILIWITSFKMPDFNSFEDRKITNSTKVYDRTGRVVLFDLNEDFRRTNISLSEMGENIQKTTIAVEDSDFYNHNGVKISSTIRAVLANIFSISKTQGGSTITQQLVKNTLLNQKKTYTRKIKEWVLALKIEKTFSKEKILEMYLNEIPYGGMVYGIKEASNSFFGKEPIELSLAEAAYLASIPQAPTTLSPYGKNLKKLEERKNFVLFRAKELSLITEEEYNKAKEEKVVFQPRDVRGIKAPHFVFFIKDYLDEKYGPELVETGGLKVITTLDYEMQKRAEEIVKNEALKNEKEWNGSNASLVAIDPKTGQILALVGSRDYFDKNIDGNFNVAIAERQPGSAFKPFIYANAFNKGFTPNTVLFDLPTEFNVNCGPYGGGSQCYMPDNYDGKHRGPMSLRDALAQSINIPAVKLFYLSGVNDSVRLAENMGITTLVDPKRYGLSLVIGGGEVTLLDITSAYGVFANNGIKNEKNGILKIEDKTGKVLEEFKLNEKTIMPKNTALLISDILSDNQSRIPTFGANSPLLISGYDTAAKTGTTNNNKDAWTVGYSPNLVVGVWVGNNDNKPMKKGGVALAGPIWNKFMSQTLNTLPIERFEKADLYFNKNKYKPVLRGLWQGNESYIIDKISGKLATELTPEETKEERVLTNVHTILYWIDKDNIMGTPPQNQNDPQFKNWEIPIQNWWQKNSYKYPFVDKSSIPKEYDDIHTENSQIIFEITNPQEEQIYKKEDTIELQIINKNNTPLKKMDIFINGSFFETINPPFSFSFTPNTFSDLSYRNEIKIIAYDMFYNKGEAISYFKVE